MSRAQPDREEMQGGKIDNHAGGADDCIGQPLSENGALETPQQPQEIAPAIRAALAMMVKVWFGAGREGNVEESPM